MRLALVYDRVNKIGGAERVLLALHEIWPQAPLYTSVYNPQTAPWADSFKVVTSFLQQIPGAKAHHEWYAWLTPLAFESFDFSGFEVVISVTSAEAKGIITSQRTFHLCYCLTPTRYLWSGKVLYEGKGMKSWGLKVLGTGLRAWDYQAAQRPDVMVAISQTVQERIFKYYRRQVEVIYPPLDTGFFKPSLNQRYNQKKGKSFYLIVSRLVAYKRLDLAIEAFNELEKKLVIVGEGEEERRLKSLARPNITFVGKLTDKELLRYYRGCRAIVFPGEEDLGLVALEGQALGKPVIAYKKGGVGETVIDGKTGLLFAQQNSDCLKRTIIKFEKMTWWTKKCRRQALKFAKSAFKNKFRNFVEEQWQKHQKNT